VTLFLFLLNSEGNGQFVSAGHNPAYLFRSATGLIEELGASGTILGVFDEVFHDAFPLHLGKGDILVVYSDGLTEASNHSEEMFGTERLVEIIQRMAPAGSLALKAAFLRAIEEFTMGMPQTDDVTFLIVEKSR
jgi:sigma-B regulation protein RsbU (phosphoserine phosphatase)